MQPPVEWIEALWDSITWDLSSYLVALDVEDRIVYANRAAASWLGIRCEARSEPTLGEVFPSRIAKERLGLARQVRVSGQPIVVDGAIRGEGLRCAMRPTRPQVGTVESEVLLCFRPLALIEVDDDDLAEPAPIVAQTHDWGILNRLTRRELQVLGLIASGLTTKQIAGYFHRSRRTIDCHRASIGQKLGVTNRMELTLIGLRAGLAHIAASQPHVV